MTQTLASTPSAPPPASATQSSLFDLLARTWRLESPVASVALDSAGRTAAFAQADGRLALVPLEDPDSALGRMRVEADSGRSTIRPRLRPVAPPVMTPALAEGAAMLAASGKIGFLVAARDGRLTRVTPRGQVIALQPAGDAVSALASDGKGRLALAHDGRTEVYDEERLQRRIVVLTEGAAATALAFSADDEALAVMLPDRLILCTRGQSSTTLPLGGAGPLQFSAAGDWLAGADGAGGLWLLRVADGQVARLDKFRAPPVSVAFSAPARAVFAGGAFRLAGWSLDTPPLDDAATGALRSGRPGLVLIEQVACHAKRDLVAFGSADGAVSITRAGHADELLLRPADGAAVTALAWSADGSALAIGTAAGDAAVVTLPPQLFK